MGLVVGLAALKPFVKLEEGCKKLTKIAKINCSN